MFNTGNNPANINSVTANLNVPISDLGNQSNSNPVGSPQPHHHDILAIFKLSGSSLQVWKSKHLNKTISYRLCIIDFRRKDSEIEAKHDDVSSNISEYVNNNSKVEIAVLSEDGCKFKNQEQFGQVFNPNDYVFLKATIDDISKWVSEVLFVFCCRSVLCSYLDAFLIEQD